MMWSLVLTALLMGLDSPPYEGHRIRCFWNARKRPIIDTVIKSVDGWHTSDVVESCRADKHPQNEEACFMQFTAVNHIAFDVYRPLCLIDRFPRKSKRQPDVCEQAPAPTYFTVIVPDYFFCEPAP